MKFHVIDNVIGEKHSQYVFEKCVSLKWTFVPDISFGSRQGKNSPGFSHSFYLKGEYNNNGSETIVTPEYDFIKPILLEGLDKLNLGLNLEDLFRSRARLTIPRPELSEEERIDAAHIDYGFPHLVLIYYVNSVDGDTLLLDGNDKIVERVSPRRGRVLLFDGSIRHCSTTPTQNPRIIINNNISKG